MWRFEGAKRKAREGTQGDNRIFLFNMQVEKTNEWTLGGVHHRENRNIDIESSGGVFWGNRRKLGLFLLGYPRASSSVWGALLVPNSGVSYRAAL